MNRRALFPRCRAPEFSRKTARFRRLRLMGTSAGGLVDVEATPLSDQTARSGSLARRCSKA